MLLAKGADINAKDNSGATPPVVAEEEGYPEIAELMRKYKEEKHKENNTQAKLTQR